MPSKKKYNSRFPPARIKKIMQMDEEVGKVAAPVPVIISRVLELFVEEFLKKANDMASTTQVRTLGCSHLYHAANNIPRLHFLLDLVRQHNNGEAMPVGLLPGPEDDAATVDAAAESQGRLRVRGRPFKRSASASGFPLNSSLSPPTKRGRGRPRKEVLREFAMRAAMARPPTNICFPSCPGPSTPSLSAAEPTSPAMSSSSCKLGSPASTPGTPIGLFCSEIPGSLLGTGSPSITNKDPFSTHASVPVTASFSTPGTSPVPGGIPISTFITTPVDVAMPSCSNYASISPRESYKAISSPSPLSGIKIEFGGSSILPTPSSLTGVTVSFGSLLTSPGTSPNVCMSEPTETKMASSLTGTSVPISNLTSTSLVTKEVKKNKKKGASNENSAKSGSKSAAASDISLQNPLLGKIKIEMPVFQSKPMDVSRSISSLSTQCGVNVPPVTSVSELSKSNSVNAKKEKAQNNGRVPVIKAVPGSSYSYLQCSNVFSAVKAEDNSDEDYDD